MMETVHAARRRARRALMFVGVGLTLAVGVAPAQAASSNGQAGLHGGGPGGNSTGHKVH